MTRLEIIDAAIEATEPRDPVSDPRDAVENALDLFAAESIVRIREILSYPGMSSAAYRAACETEINSLRGEGKMYDRRHPKPKTRE